MSAPTSTEKSVMLAVDGLASLLLTPPLVAYSAFVAWKLWTWFAVPNDLPVLSYGSVGVLAALWSAWTIKTTLYKDTREQRSLVKVQIEMAIARTLALGAGYAFKTWGGM